VLLVAPTRHLWDCCFADQRMRSIGLFAVGYLAVWTAAGAPLLVAAKAISEIQFAPALVTSALVLVWQVSPAKQACLNRCHRRP